MSTFCHILFITFSTRLSHSQNLCLLTAEVLPAGAPPPQGLLMPGTLSRQELRALGFAYVWAFLCMCCALQGLLTSGMLFLAGTVHSRVCLCLERFSRQLRAPAFACASAQMEDNMKRRSDIKMSRRRKKHLPNGKKSV